MMRDKTFVDLKLQVEFEINNAISCEYAYSYCAYYMKRGDVVEKMNI